MFEFCMILSLFMWTKKCPKFTSLYVVKTPRTATVFCSILPPYEINTFDLYIYNVANFQVFFIILIYITISSSRIYCFFPFLSNDYEYVVKIRGYGKVKYCTYCKMYISIFYPSHNNVGWKHFTIRRQSKPNISSCLRVKFKRYMCLVKFPKQMKMLICIQNIVKFKVFWWDWY